MSIRQVTEGSYVPYTPSFEFYVVTRSYSSRLFICALVSKYTLYLYSIFRSTLFQW